MRLVGHHLSPPVVMAEDRAEISALPGQAVGPPLAHAHAMAMALTRHQQLPPRQRLPALASQPPSSAGRGRATEAVIWAILEPP